MLDTADADRDGDTAREAGGTDCNDHDPKVSTRTPETCDGHDDDCDGAIDEGSACIAGTDRSCDPAGRLRQRCSAACTWSECEPTEPVCPDPECEPGRVEACSTGCGDGERLCNATCRWEACACPELCNGQDDDGDGRIDEGSWGLSTGAVAVDDDEGTWAGGAAATDEGRLGVARVTSDPTLTSSLVVSWMDTEGRVVEGETLVADRADTSFHPAVVSAGSSLVVRYDLFSVPRLAVVSPAGVAADWTLGFPWLEPRLFFDGARIGVQEDDLLAWFGLGGSADGEPSTLPVEGTGPAVWSGTAVVISGPGTVTWLSAEGELLVTSSLAFDVEPVLASDGTSVVAATESEGQIELAKFTADGLEVWRTRAAAIEPMVAMQALPIREGWLIVRQNDHSTNELGGWLVRDDGTELRSPALWTGTTVWLDFFAFATVVEDVAFVGISPFWLGLARVGCYGNEVQGGGK